MARGISLHIGVNKVDPAHYGGWEGPLQACEFDAGDMAELAKQRGFEPHVLLTSAATAAAVTAAIAGAAAELSSGDIFFLTYAGHGSQVPDRNSDEQDRMDETWVLYDRQLVDDELYDLWSRFQPGVRIVVLSDSCHSGTAIRNTRETVRPEALDAAADLHVDDAERLMRAMPERFERAVYEGNQELYDGIQRAVPAGDTAEVRATILLLSGCQDNQTSSDGSRNGLFTQTLKTVLESRDPKSYRRLWKQIVSAMPPWQSPNYFLVGAPNPDFEQQRPFTV